MTFNENKKIKSTNS